MDESSRASHKEVTTQTEKLLTTEGRTANDLRGNRAIARNNTLRRSEEGRSAGVSLGTKNRHILRSAWFSTTHHSSTCCPQRMLNTLQFPQTTLTERRWLFSRNPSTLWSSKLSVIHVCGTPLSGRIDQVMSNNSDLISYSRMPFRPYESRQAAPIGVESTAGAKQQKMRMVPRVPKR